MSPGKSALVALFSVLLLLSACGGFSATIGAATIAGSAGDGPITGGVITVTDSSGATVTTTPASPKTDATAHYSFTVPPNTPLPLIVTVKNGEDSVTGAVQGFALTAAVSVLPASGTVTLNVNPITTLVTASALARGALSAASLKTATANVLNTLGFGLPAGFDPESTKVNVANVASVIKANEAVAELIRRVKVSTGKTMAKAIRAIAEDVTDGVLDGKVAAGVKATQATARTAGVIMTDQAEIAAALLANQLKITDKNGVTKVTAADSRKRLNAAILVTQPTTRGNEADVSQVKVTQKFIDQTKRAIALANILAGGGNAELNNLEAAINALSARAAPGSTQATDILTALNEANTALETADTNAGAGTNTDAVSVAATDTTAPTITSHNPLAKATDAPLAAAIDVTFSEPVTHVTTSTFTVTPAGGVPISGSINHNTGNNESFTHAALKLGTAYTVAVTRGITDVAGNALTAASWSFTTRHGWAQEAYIKASNANALDRFGYSVSLNAGTLAVGARYESSSQTTITNGTGASSDNSAASAGAVYTYRYR